MPLGGLLPYGPASTTLRRRIKMEGGDLTLAERLAAVERMVRGGDLPQPHTLASANPGNEPVYTTDPNSYMAEERRGATPLQRLLGYDLDEPDDQRLQRLEGLRNVAEGFGGIAESGRRAGRIRLGLDPEGAAPAVAPGIRARIAQVLSDRARRRDLDLQTSRDTRRFGQQKELAATNRSSIAAEGEKNRALSRELAGTRAEDRDLDRDVKKEQLATMRAERERRFGRLPAGQNKEVSDMRNFLGLLDTAGDLYEAAASKVGPIESRARGALKKLWGAGDPDFRKLESHLDQIIFEFTFLKTGKAAAEVERKDYRQALMSKIDEPDQFYAALDQLKENMNQLLQERLAGFKAGGFSVEGMDRPSEDLATSSAVAPSSEEWIEVEDPKTGRVKPVHRDDVPEALRRGGLLRKK